MLLKITDGKDVDDNKLMGVYAQSNRENVKHFYPQITDTAEAIRHVKRDFCRYLKTEFLNGDNLLFVWEESGTWVSALRLYAIGDNFYYLEALETSPSRRKAGYAERLLRGTIDELCKGGSFQICDCVEKTNVASLRTHEKCGFVIADETRGYDYLQNEFDEACFGLKYTAK